MDLKIKPKTKMTIINRSQEDGPGHRVIEKIEVVKDFIYPGIKYEQL